MSSPKIERSSRKSGPKYANANHLANFFSSSSPSFNNAVNRSTSSERSYRRKRNQSKAPRQFDRQDFLQANFRYDDMYLSSHSTGIQDDFELLF